MCFAAVIKVHQSLGWGKIQTGRQRKKSWVQIVDLPRVRWSQILFVLHCLTEALSKKYTQAKFAACINKLNVTGVSCLHQQWMCLPGFKWFLHSLMSEHKTIVITGSKLTNYACFLFLAAEVGGRLLVLLGNLLPFFLSLVSWHKEVLCEAVLGEVDIKAQGPCPNAKRFSWQGPWGGQTAEHKWAVRLQQGRWGTVFILSLLVGSDLGPLGVASPYSCTYCSP